MNARAVEVVDVPLLNPYQPEPEPEATPAPDAAALDEQMRRLDHELLQLVQRRTELARRLAERRVAEGGTRYVHEHELAVVRRYRSLGPDGPALGLLLLRMAR
ncbi:chorismate mutase [Actinoplanes sp. CA-015351]|uniref:chorismate mutase n=1 Tax=Actinoplanes sp. CA-015351 TaxID=3239897 RepID=UPI003D9861AB